MRGSPSWRKSNLKSRRRFRFWTPNVRTYMFRGLYTALAWHAQSMPLAACRLFAADRGHLAAVVGHAASTTGGDDRESDDRGYEGSAATSTEGPPRWVASAGTPA